MFNRLTVKTLLQSTLLILAVLAVVPLTMRAWDAMQTLRSSARILRAADASSDVFQVMINVRSARNSVPRVWASPAPLTGDVRTYIKRMQDAEMPPFDPPSPNWNPLNSTTRPSCFPPCASRWRR